MSIFAQFLIIMLNRESVYMKKIFLSVVLFFLSLALWAVPASPYPFDVTLPDGSTMTVKLVGDEYHAYYTTEDGVPLRRLENGFFVEDPTIVEQSIQIAAQRRSAAVHPNAKATQFPLSGDPKSLVLLVEFQDKAFTEKLEDFDKLLNEVGYSYNGATGSCRDYFIAASDSVFQPHFDVFGPFTLGHDMAYYGAEEGDSHDKDPYSMVIEACQIAAENGVNFADYDLDNDDVLDNVFIYYAGHNQAEGASSNTIWPHKSDVSWRNVKVDGKRLATYACTSEYSGSGGTRRASIGTFCHEFGHVLGLPDLYDTDYKYYTVSNWDIMCSGNYNNNGNTPPTYSSYERFFLGWLQPEQLLEKGQYFLNPIQLSNSAYLIATDSHNMIGANPSPKEFFMLEYRTKTGWDTYLPGQGMLVWHIDYSAAAWANNTPNNGPNFLRIHLEEANGILWNQRSAGENGKSSDPYPGTQNVTTFVPELHDGTRLIDQNVFDIVESDGWISFIYQSIGNVKMSTDIHDLSITTTVSDSKKIVDWNPQSFMLTAQDLNIDTITFTTKGNFYVAVGEECPKTSSSGWAKTLHYKVPADVSTHKVWVSYLPNKQSCDETISNLTISTLGATIPIVLHGYSPRPTYITTPNVLPATKITPYSFRLSWEPVEDAVQYYLTLYQVADGDATYRQDFEDFSSFDAINEQGWESNVNRTTTSAKSDGTKALYFKNTGEYIISEEYMAPLQSISFWVHAFFSDSVKTGYLDLDVWDGSEWISQPEHRVNISSSTKNTIVTLDFESDIQYTRVRLTYTDIGGSGIAFDAFKATCTSQITYVYRGKDLAIDAFTYDSNASSYEITGLNANATYYCSMQSSDVTKGCEEHISPMSEPIEIKTLEVQEGDKKEENRIPLVIDYTNYDKPTPIVYLDEPIMGRLLNVYNVDGTLICSIPVHNGVAEYVIPTNNLQSGKLYLIKYLVNGKIKRKQGWAKFIL